MTRKFLFPIKSIPSFEDLLDIFVDGFHGLSLSTQHLVIGLSAKKTLNLFDKFIHINDYKCDNYCCWASFHYLELECREDDCLDYPVMAGVGVRGEVNKKFATIITHILANSLGAPVIYDDSSLLQKKGDYLLVSDLDCVVEQYIKDLYM